MKGQRVFILLLSGILLYSIRHGQLGGTRSCQGSVTISSPAAATAGDDALLCGQCQQWIMGKILSMRRQWQEKVFHV